MTGTGPGSTYRNVVEITTSYLGPAAERFVERQVHACLNKRPEDLHSEDIAQLTDCITKAVAEVIGEKATIDDFARRLMSLSSHHAEPVR